MSSTTGDPGTGPDHDDGSELPQPPSALERKAIIDRSRTVAVVGASANRSRASYFVMTYLIGVTDMAVHPVNPREDEILDRRCVGSLSELGFAPDLVDVFRRPEDCPAVAEEAVAVGAKALWLQLGIVSDEAARIAHRAGLDVVMDRCLKIEHARFAGGLHLAGFDTGVIDSRRRR
ncbi:MAG: CoA-binding protein [Actinomycetota bacterium]|nr:CoA-binding protein [Actinomycetota bacterium]